MINNELINSNVLKNENNDDDVIWYDSAESLARALMQYLIDHDIESIEDDDLS
jgi:hypothetical protein